MESLRELQDVWKQFEGLSDEAVVRADLAATFLGISKKTLARLRQEETGPPYIQVVADGSSARNQIVNYPMGELRVYRKSLLVTSPMKAAQMRGLAFETVGDLLEEQPFWQVTTTSMAKGGIGRGNVRKERCMIVGHVQTVSDKEFDSFLHDSNAEVIWLSIHDAMNRPWANAEARKLIHQAYIGLLQDLIEASNSQQLAAEIHSQL